MKKMLEDFISKERKQFEWHRIFLTSLVIITQMTQFIAHLENKSMALYFLLIAIILVGIQFIFCHFLKKAKKDSYWAKLLLSIGVVIISLCQYFAIGYITSHYGVGILIYITSLVTIIVLLVLYFLKEYVVNKTVLVLTMVLVLHCPLYVAHFDNQYKIATVKHIIEVEDYSFIKTEEDDSYYILDSSKQGLLLDICENSKVLIKFRDFYWQSDRKDILDIENYREIVHGTITYLNWDEDYKVAYIILDHQSDNVYELEIDTIDDVSALRYLEEGKLVKLEHNKHEDGTLIKVQNLSIENNIEQEAL